MVNRNAARHLLFGVSILICLFVYIGYRLGTRPAAPAPAPAGAGSDAIAGLDVDESQSPEEQSAAAAAAVINAIATTPPGTPVRPPDLSSSGLPIMSDDEMDADDSHDEWVASSRGEVLKLSSPPASAPPGSPLRPASSEALDASNLIAGLVPDTAPASTRGESVADEVEDEDFDDGEEIFLADASPSGTSSLPSSVSPPGGQLKPPGQSDAAPSMSLPIPPPGGGAAAPPASVQPVSGGGFVPPPPGGGIRPSEPARMAAVSSPPETRPPAFTPPVQPPQTPQNVERTQPPVSTPIPPAPPATTPPIDDVAGAGSRRDSPQGSESLRIYVVRSGDTLSSIASQELGSVSLADNIFLINRNVISDPDHLMVGMKIRLPVPPARDEFHAAPPSVVPAPGVSAPPIRRPTQGLGRVHRVMSGDTLSSISQHYYGTSAGWRFLYEANRNVMSNPNQLAVGMELSVPPYEETP